MAEDGQTKKHQEAGQDGTSPDKKLEQAEREATFADYLRIFTYAEKWDFVVYFVASIASIGAGVSLPLMIIIFGQLVNQFTEYFRDADAMSPSEFEDILSQQALYIMALFLGRWALNAINMYCFRMIGLRLSSAIRLHYLRCLLDQSIHVIDTMPAGAPATAITSTSNTLQLGISERLGTFLQSQGTIWGALIVAFVWNWELTLVTSSLIIYLLVVLAVCIPPFLKVNDAATKADSKAIAVASEALGAMRLIMAFGAEEKFSSAYAKNVYEARKQAEKGAPILSAQLGLIYFGIFGAFGLAFWYGTRQYSRGNLEGPGVVVIVLMSVMVILTSLERVSTPLIAVSNATVAACTFFTVIDAPRPERGTMEIDLDGADIVFEDVTFAYPGRPCVKILDNLNLCIKSGMNTALVGPSGSGKSTIAGLLAQWYLLRDTAVVPQVKVKDPKASTQKDDDSKEKVPGSEAPQEKETEEAVKLSGKVSIGGQSLEDLELHWWRRQVAIVQQEPFLFNETIFNNVSNGLIGTQWENESEASKRELVEEACREAFADEFIARLPDGYDTRVGDGGAKLSGGQKQRIAIARSIIKKPRIIILDEATSALDTKSEKLVQVALEKVSQGRTTITIAHRLSTIMKADQIVVLDKGSVVEQGSHQSLMAASGAYSKLVEGQSLSATTKEGTQTKKTTLDVQHDEEVKSTAASDVPIQGDVGAEENAQENRRSLKNSFGTLLLRQRGQWLYYAGVVASAMVISAGTPLQAWLFSQVVNVFLLPLRDMESESSFWALMWLALAGGVGAFYFVTGIISLYVQHAISAVYKRSYFADMLRQRLLFFDKDSNSHGALSARISSDAKQLEELLGINMAFFFIGIFTVVGCAIIALVFAWRLALVATLVTMPIMLIAGYRKFRYEVQFNDMNAAVFQESSQFATEAIGAIRTVSVLNMEAAIIERYQKLMDNHVRVADIKARWTALLFGFADSVSLGCQALVFWYGGTLLVDGEYSIEAFLVCFMAAVYGAESASQALSISPNAANVVAAANRILDVEQSASQSTDIRTVHAAPEGAIIVPDQGGVQIELRAVSFQYPTRQVPVFESFDLAFEKGTYVALVGPSGCGKSTIIALLERFYDIKAGEGAIICNGVNINDMDMHTYRSQLALVPQEPTLFQGSIRDNILLGVEDPKSITDQMVEQVCRDAFIHDFIVSLPEGYNTNVGQRGVAMSGGQKQRIAIARALIRDPRVLLLDEATSALDSESESMVQAAIEKARQGRTVIAVAHRLSTIRDADTIVVLDNGQVVEKGTHNALLQRRGVYWEMCENQSLAQ